MENIKQMEKMLVMSIFEVFEKMYYIFAEPLSLAEGKYHMRSTISFDGPVSGGMDILVSQDISVLMLKNMLGLEREEITEQVEADCVKESLNMICGNFVRKLNPEKGFHLSIPTFEMVSENTRNEERTKDPDICLTFAAEDGNIQVSMTVADKRS